MKKLIFILILLFITTISYSAEYENFCHDHESWTDWDKLALKHPHDMDIQLLHAVRIGFCKKIEDGSISIETAVEAFDHLMKTVKEKTIKETEQRKKNKQL